jgi:hypothetical protein
LLHVTGLTRGCVKRGNARGDYEDAAWPLSVERRGTRAVRCAVADGATEASFSGEWARLLVRAYCDGRLRDGCFAADIDRLGRIWSAEVGSRPLPWYAEQKLASGAFSSLVGITVDARGVWRATAVGDSCLVHVRNEAILSAFPLARSADFTSTPGLISTSATANAHVTPKRAWGRWEAGDAMYLMTDALAAWCLRRVEMHRPPWPALDAALRGSPARFNRWINLQRDAGGLRNDDVTVQRITLF